ncbi:hypothetical protein [Alkalilimnicola ehrlichii]|uniref:Uncharacterized protein n=1 Tax=Alkalilimnicola ehrlichii TaxID=351052 RepID=A0A3E0X1F7_9GAMM|nr:hypothetical protein [Alkalilimnicola ehrlichii]RFA38085.1 hypothetical protein CAL65_07060 [Alkalilimnicola ehrlichii]
MATFVKTLDNVEHTVKSLEQRAENIDAQMDAYDKLRSENLETSRALTASAFSQFFTTGAILAIAALAGLVNYHLLAPGMSLLMDGSVGNTPMANLTAGFLTLLQVGMGLVMLESLRVTRMLPLIGGLDDLPRHRLVTAAAAMLLALIVWEASLVFSQAGLVDGEGHWAVSMGMLVLGTILPLVLAFVAIPLEGFINSGRTVLGALAATLLRLLAASLRIVGNLITGLGQVLIRVYDLIIFLPLWLESALRRNEKSSASKRSDDDLALADDETAPAADEKEQTNSG